MKPLDWSFKARSIWGKSPREDGLPWTPLVVHLEDAVFTAGHIFDHWLSRAAIEFFRRKLNCSHVQARNALCFVASQHDLAKAAPSFSAKVPELAGFAAQYGLLSSKDNCDSELGHHTVVGELLFRDYLIEKGAGRAVASSWAEIIGAHHGRSCEVSTLHFAQNEILRFGGDVAWQEVQREIFDRFFDALDMAHNPILTTPLDTPTQIRMTGFLIQADWMASKEEYFPQSGIGLSRRSRNAKAESAIQLPRPWTPDVPIDAQTLLSERFPPRSSDEEGFVIHPSQQMMFDAAMTMPEPGLMILEAPMGEGKTEAGWMAAEVLAARFGFSGVQFALPTRSTADSIFTRMTTWLKNHPPHSAPEGTNLWLGHGRNRSNKDFEHLFALRGATVKDSAGGGSVHEFFVSKMTPLVPMSVSTIDHVLLAGRRSKFVMLRHYGLANKVVICDEVHANDTYMNVYLRAALQWLGRLGVPVILMTATLPPEQRADLVAAYLNTKRARELEHLKKNTDYPLLTVATSQGIHQETCESSREGREFTVELVDDAEPTLFKEVANVTDAGGCVLILRNTVKRATATYLALKEAGFDVTLAHSLYLSTDRAKKDRQLTSWFKRGATRPRGKVVVATQVAEQSLDIDLDLLITDIAPMDLILQRAGRIFRHDREDRAVTTPRILITGFTHEEHDEDTPAMVAFERGANYIYGEWTLRQAHRLLSERSHIVLPDDIPQLVRAAYQPHILTGQSSPEETAWNTWENRQQVQRARAQQWTMKPTQSSMRRAFAAMAGCAKDDDDTAVRDGFAVEAVVVNFDGKNYRILNREGLHRPGAVLNTNPQRGFLLLDEVLDLLDCSLRLPPGLIHDDKFLEALGAQTPAVFNKTSKLKGIRLLALNRSMSTTLAGFSIRYSDELGLLHAKLD